VSKSEVNIRDADNIEQLIRELNPWAVVLAPDYIAVDAAEQDEDTCFDLNAHGPSALAEVCAKYPLKLVCFSSDLVFDGKKQDPYVESDAVNPLNVYGQSNATAEANVLKVKPEALIIRTGCLFSPFDQQNFVANTLADLKQGRNISLANDVYISPTYVPDLVHEALDLLLDDEQGIIHVTNEGQTTWADLGMQIAEMAGCDKTLIHPKPLSQLNMVAERPKYSVLQSELGIRLPALDDALFRYFEVTNVYQSGAIAV
jgi:dTDP-4-dehydrorhamnose reductase